MGQIGAMCEMIWGRGWMMLRWTHDELEPYILVCCMHEVVAVQDSFLTYSLQLLRGPKTLEPRIVLSYCHGSEVVLRINILQAPHPMYSEVDSQYRISETTINNY